MHSELNICFLMLTYLKLEFMTAERPMLSHIHKAAHLQISCISYSVVSKLFNYVVQIEQYSHTD